MRDKCDFPQDLCAEWTWTRTEGVQAIDAGLAPLGRTRVNDMGASSEEGEQGEHFMIASSYEEAQLRVEITVRLAYGALVIRGLWA